MRNMKNDGKSLIIITHKLHEVLDVSDRVAVLRKGRYIGDVATCDTSPQKLTDMMVGHAVTLNIDRPLVEDRNLRLEVKDLTVLTPDSIKALDHVSFDAYGGEILGIAGISGSGQKELLEAIGQMMDEKLDRKLQPIVDRLDKLEESSEEVRSGVNALLEWAEECGNVIKFPLPKVK